MKSYLCDFLLPPMSLLRKFQKLLLFSNLFEAVNQKYTEKFTEFVLIISWRTLSDIAKMKIHINVTLKISFILLKDTEY